MACGGLTTKRVCLHIHAKCAYVMMCIRHVESLEKALADLQAFRELVQTTLSQPICSSSVQRTSVATPDTVRPSSKASKEEAV